jgi:hypothetical protein
MKKLLVYLDEDFHEALKELAHRRKTTMAALVRYAVDKTFEDELDVIGADLSWAEYLRDPAGAISLDDYLKERGIELPPRNNTKSSQRTQQVADQRSPYRT